MRAVSIAKSPRTASGSPLAALVAAVVAGLLALAPLTGFAQAPAAGGREPAAGSQASGSPSAGSQAAGPKETEELVLPPIVLEVEDLSVVRIEARLPPEEELLPPDRSIPLPEAGELPIGEPSLPSAGLMEPQPSAAVAASALTADIALGGGTANHVSARVNLRTASGSPFALSFSHESLDGFSGRPSGAGFGNRNDLLDGSLRFALGGASVSARGSLNDDEIGLQGQSPYGARAVRLLGGGVGISGSVAGWLSLGARVDADASLHTLTGASPLQTEEVRLSPALSATATFDRVAIALSSDYGFHGGTFGPDHRFRATATLGVELSSAWSLDGSVGWHWASSGLSVFPFSLGLTGVAAEVLTFSVRGGYRATAIDLAELLAQGPLLEPSLTHDSSGWFGETSVSLGLAKGIAANLGLAFAMESAMVDSVSPSLTPNAATGLFTVYQRSANRLTLDAGARWSPAVWLTLNASGALELLDRPLWEPVASLNVEASAIEAAGRSGGRLSVKLLGDASGLRLPEVGLGAFIRLSQAVRLRLDVDDLLSPLAGERVDLGPYLRPGLLATAAAEITF